jgi:hypothetical protein
MDQKLTIGDVGVVVKNETEYAFYLVTKNYCNGTSTMLSLSHSLKSLVEKMQERKIIKLGIPQIGCRTNGLEWSKVKPLIEDIFAGSGIEITVCVPTKVSVGNNRIFYCFHNHKPILRYSIVHHHLK